MEGRVDLPLFPLRAVLFSGGRLPLQIFEPRYLDMIGRCSKNGTGFGVVLIRDGFEAHADEAPTIFDIGTYASIVDFDSRADGRLEIVAEGGPKLRIYDTWEEDNHLMMGSVELLPDERPAAIGDEHQALVEILRHLVKQPMVKRLGLSFDVDYDDARSVGWRLAELLPIEWETKQSLLQMNMPRERLAEIKRLLNKFRGATPAN